MNQQTKDLADQIRITADQLSGVCVHDDEYQITEYINCFLPSVEIKHYWLNGNESKYLYTFYHYEHPDSLELMEWVRRVEQLIAHSGDGGFSSSKLRAKSWRSECLLNSEVESCENEHFCTVGYLFAVSAHLAERINSAILMAQRIIEFSPEIEILPIPKYIPEFANNNFNDLFYLETNKPTIEIKKDFSFKWKPWKI